MNSMVEEEAITSTTDDAKRKKNGIADSWKNLQEINGDAMNKVT